MRSRSRSVRLQAAAKRVRAYAADRGWPPVLARRYRRLCEACAIETMEVEGPLSRHLLLELEAVHDRGRPLSPGQPVPRCGCERCTGIPRAERTTARAGKHPDKRDRSRRRPRRDLRPALDVDAARAASILDVAARLGIEHRRGYARCPFHDDSRPSLHLNAAKNRAYCNPCGRSWDPIALVMELRRCSLRGRGARARGMTRTTEDSMDEVIGATALRNGEELRITASEYRGHVYVHVRRYFKNENGAMVPGKGVALPLDLFPWALAALHDAERLLLRAGKLGPEDYSNHGLPLPAELEDAA